MRVHVLQHAPFEGLGNIESWLIKQNAQITFTRFYESEALPALGGIDFIIAMGGPMSVNDESELPWLVPEKRFIADAIDRGVAVLGVCLGAQLIASAKGAKVYPASEKEIGWHPLMSAASQAESESFKFPATTQVLHWHGETFDLPVDAVHLASSAACKNQAFQLGECVIGLQFHMEMMPAGIEAMLTHCANELTVQKHVQPAEIIRDVPQERFMQTEKLMHEVLSYLTRNRT